jgi:hypothetical protein
MSMGLKAAEGIERIRRAVTRHGRYLNGPETGLVVTECEISGLNFSYGDRDREDIEPALAVGYRVFALYKDE